MVNRQSVLVYLFCLVAVLAFPSTIAQNRKVRIQRMFGGQGITIDKAAYTVQIRTINGHFGCGGTLVTPQHVVTAAHCIDRVDPKRHLFVVGDASIRNGKGVFRTIVDSFIPAEYVSGIYHADVAVLKLNSPIVAEGTHIRSIPLCKKALQPGDLVRVSGWGRTAANEPPSKELRTIEFPVITNEECSTKLKLSEDTKNFTLTDTMVCGLAPKEGPCKGDSGGPVVHNGELCAVVSWGRGNCVYDDTPAVYSSVDAMRSFLEDAFKK